MADGIFDHHHCAGDHHDKVESPKREQVGWNVGEVETNGGEQQRERNGERDDDGAAHISEEQKENDGDEYHAFGQVMFDGFDRVFDQHGAVEEGNDLYAPWQDARIQFIDLLMNALQDGIGVVPLLQENDAFNRVWIVDDRAIGAVIGTADLAEPDLRT